MGKLDIEEEIEDTLVNRVGQFALQINKGKVFENEQQVKELKAIMNSIIVVRATHLTEFDQIHYVALSEQFDLINVKDNVPVYLPEFTIDKETDEIIQTEWRRQK